MPVTALNRRAVYNPRPVIHIDGQSYEKVNELVLAMDMREQEGGLSSLELRLSNIASDADGGADYAFEDEAEVKLGSSITIFGGDISAPQEIFRGLITGLEADFPEDDPPELLILAEDHLQQARMARRSEVHREKSLADLVREVAQRLGLQSEINGLDSPLGTWVQLNESDLAFLRRLLRGVDADMQIVGETLQASPRSEVQRNVIEVELFHDLRSVKFIADLANQVTRVTATGWNPLRGQRVSGSSQGVNFGPGNGRRGAQILQESLGECPEHIGHISVTTDEEAQALADAVFDQRARRFVCAEGTATGHPSLRVGSHLRLRGVSQRFENTYYIVSTHHRYDQQDGYNTDFMAECASLGETG